MAANRRLQRVGNPQPPEDLIAKSVEHKDVQIADDRTQQSKSEIERQLCDIIESQIRGRVESKSLAVDRGKNGVGRDGREEARNYRAELEGG